MSDIRNLCEEILAHLTSIGYPTRFEPGLSFQEIENVQRDLPFIFPKSLVEMYQWRNGTQVIPGDTTPGACFFPWWCFDTITESVGRYRVLSVPAGCDPELWDPSWFNMFSSSDISSIGICCSPSQADDGQMMCYQHTAVTQVEYISLRSMLRTICAAYKARVIFIGDDGDLDYDVKAYSEIHKGFNPGVQRLVE